MIFYCQLHVDVVFQNQLGNAGEIEGGQVMRQHTFVINLCLNDNPSQLFMFRRVSNNEQPHPLPFSFEKWLLINRKSHVKS